MTRRRRRRRRRKGRKWRRSRQDMDMNGCNEEGMLHEGRGRRGEAAAAGKMWRWRDEGRKEKGMNEEEE